MTSSAAATSGAPNGQAPPHAPDAGDGTAPAAAASGPEGNAEQPAPPQVTTVILLRHGRSSANTAGVLAGRTPGVQLDDVGRRQAEAVADRLAGIPLHRLISSPMERCQQTIAPLAAATGLPVELDDGLAEVDYGDWSGRALKDLAREPLWKVVQQYPSAALFPGGESLGGMSSRVVAAVHAILDAELRHPAAPASPANPAGGRTVLLCSHGDVIKALLADALGMHVDAFQRIVVDTASLSVIRYTPFRPFVERFNDCGDLEALRPPPALAEAEHTPGGGQPGIDPPDAQVGAVSDAVPGGTVR